MNDDQSKGCLAVIGILLFVAFIACTARGCGDGYSDGQRSGELRKISHKGIVWKSYEGQLLLSNGYIRKPDGSGSPDIWNFSVVDEDVAKKLESLPPDAKVTLTYRQWFIGPVWLDSKYVITGVK